MGVAKKLVNCGSSSMIYAKANVSGSSSVSRVKVMGISHRRSHSEGTSIWRECTWAIPAASKRTRRVLIKQDGGK